MAIIHDLDIYGRQNPNGTALEFFDEDVVKNALTLFLTSKRGEILKNPDLGGYIDLILFKNMNDETFQKLNFAIKNAISNFFNPYLEIQSININPEYETRSLEIGISYYNPKTRANEQTVIYTKSMISVPSQEYEDIPYQENNLYMFCLIQKPDQGNNILVYDAELAVWRWGKYNFTNFNPETDTYANDIINICNS